MSDSTATFTTSATVASTTTAATTSTALTAAPPAVSLAQGKKLGGRLHRAVEHRGGRTAVIEALEGRVTTLLQASRSGDTASIGPELRALAAELRGMWAEGGTNGGGGGGGGGTSGINGGGASGEASPRRPLPAGWKVARDGEGRRYFYHKATRHVQWEPPAAEAGDPPKPQWQSSAPPGGLTSSTRGRAETVPAPAAAEYTGDGEHSAGAPPRPPSMPRPSEPRRGSLAPALLAGRARAATEWTSSAARSGRLGLPTGSEHV